MSTPPEPAGRDSRLIEEQHVVAAPAPVPARHAVAEIAMPRPARPLYAVLVTHGMGQQLPFQTLDLIAEGLRQEDAVRQGKQGKEIETIKVANVEIGRKNERLQRTEMHLGPAGDGGCDVHVYEGYWAPLTEGRVTLRNVMSFLLSAGVNGALNSTEEFRRWLFGQYRGFVTPVRILLYLLIALAATVSLVAINTAIVTVAAARSPLVQTPAWLSNSLLGDLSTVFNILLVVAGLFGLSLLLPSRWRSPWKGALAVALFVLTLFAIIATAVAIPFLFFLHMKQNLVHAKGLPPADPEILAAGHRWLCWLNRGVEYLILAFAALAVIGVLALFFWRFLAKRRTKMKETGLAHTLSILTTVVFWLIVAGLAAEIVPFVLKVRGLPGIGASHLLRGVSWPVLMALSLFIRNFLIQYAGDVAVYVTPHRLDRFNDLRHRIQDCVLSRARAIYEATVDGAPCYSKVLIAGHSLGSVISYDVLNRLLSEDRAAQARGEKTLEVAERTGLLLTFGSLLDKTAFLFAVQGKNKTDETREGLAASIQPLISDEGLRQRLPWVNVYSPWDIFSGSLKFYDPADAAGKPPGVDNRFDTGASTLIRAHTQYWRQGGMIYSVLYDHLWAGRKPSPPSGDESPGYEQRP
jgi:hypothetical protein